MKQILFALGLVIVSANVAKAQNLATANSYIYKDYRDGATIGANITTNCIGTTTPFTCTATIPAATQGSHTDAVSASNTAGESLKSNPVTFIMILIPISPRNLRIVP